ncbi:DUF502 domain-containing protein [Mucisphaera sp.]|uniref:DUF502 domain-containing protein n=1 Tax=Mucisphaera sp. TaxID=2913024 RepID=UPI003D0C922F
MSNFKRFFFRGLGIILPTVLTAYLLVLAYGFVNDNIAEPLNTGVREALLQLTYYPAPTDADMERAGLDLPPEVEQEWAVIDDERRSKLGASYNRAQQIEARRQWLGTRPEVQLTARRLALQRNWDSVTLGTWPVLDLVGLLLAAILIYFIGMLLGSYLGKAIYKQTEDFILAIPLVSRVYPSVKQVTDFFFGDRPANQKINFNRVVAVQYPRKGLWSVGLVTGETMRMIQDEAGVDCLTVFIPSSPTPFTGYVITVPRSETLDLPITIEEALKFAVSGGVLIPSGQIIEHQVELTPVDNEDRPATAEEPSHASKS